MKKRVIAFGLVAAAAVAIARLPEERRKDVSRFVGTMMEH
jgi:hypothetical protein